MCLNLVHTLDFKTPVEDIDMLQKLCHLRFLNTHNSVHLSLSGEWKTQKNGLPRSGVIPKDLAEKSGVSVLLANFTFLLYSTSIQK